MVGKEGEKDGLNFTFNDGSEITDPIPLGRDSSLWWLWIILLLLLIIGIIIFLLWYYKWRYRVIETIFVGENDVIFTISLKGEKNVNKILGNILTYKQLDTNYIGLWEIIETNSNDTMIRIMNVSVTTPIYKISFKNRKNKLTKINGKVSTIGTTIAKSYKNINEFINEVSLKKIASETNNTKIIKESNLVEKDDKSNITKRFIDKDFKDPKVIKKIKAYVSHVVFTINQKENFAEEIGSRILMVNQGPDEKKANVDIAEFKNGSVEVTVSRINNKFPLTNLRFVDRIDSKNIIKVEGEVDTKITRKTNSSTPTKAFVTSEPISETSVRKITLTQKPVSETSVRKITTTKIIDKK